MLAGCEVVEYVQLGSTGLRVSRIGLGCGNFGGIGSAPEFFGKGESEQEAFAVMDVALEMGINFFDTADAYGGGRSEETIGRWLAQKGSSVRDQMVLSSKLFNPVGDGPNDWGLSRRRIRRQVEASLRRLGVESLDLYLIHEPDPTTPLEVTLGALDDLVHEGKVHYIGASNMPAWLTAKGLWASDRNGWEQLRWVQNAFSLLERRDEVEMLPLCEDQSLGYTPFSPLAGGLLTGKYRLEDDYPEGSRMTMRPEPYLRHWNPETFAALDRLSAAAAERDVSPAGLALAWVMEHPVVTAPIVGPRAPRHFAAVEEALRLTLSDEERGEIASWFPPPTW